MLGKTGLIPIQEFFLNCIDSPLLCKQLWATLHLPLTFFGGFFHLLNSAFNIFHFKTYHFFNSAPCYYFYWANKGSVGEQIYKYVGRFIGLHENEVCL